MVKKTLIGIYFACASAFVNAALLSVDWKSAGDKLLTRDTVAGLEWLDLSVTYGYTGSSVGTLTGAGGLAEGFRWATTQEFFSLYTNAGLPTSNGPSSPNSTNLTYIDAARDLQDLLDYKTPYPSDRATSYVSAGVLSGQISSITSPHYALGLIGVYDFFSMSESDYYRAESYFVVSSQPQSPEPHRGLYLVRDIAPFKVPEPGSLALIGLSIACIAFTRRRIGSLNSY